MVGGMEETSDSAITGQSILATIGETSRYGHSRREVFSFLFPSPISLSYFLFVISPIFLILLLKSLQM